MNHHLTDEFSRVISRVEALAASRRRPNAIFIEGGAGTGKTTLLQMLRQQLSGAVVLAPTGVAASQVGGSTIHRMFQFPFKVLQPSLDRKNSFPSPVLRKASTIIIDEAGMVRADIVDGMDYYLRRATRRSAPFGGVNMVFVGDMYQLPPVIAKAESEAWGRAGYRSEFFFDAKVFAEYGLERHSLTRVFRQREESLVGALNRIRTGAVTEEDLSLLNSRCGESIPSGIPQLNTRRDAVERVNAEAMRALRTPLEQYAGKVRGEFRPEDSQAPADLQLKPGCLVMLLNNEKNGEWQNGTTGVYEGRRGDDLLVRRADGHLLEVGRNTWEKKRYKLDSATNVIRQEVIGSYCQYPVMLSHAVTIHKSQGQTLDRAVVDLGDRVFSAGQAYVALSRVRSLGGLYLKRPVMLEDCYAAPRVVEFMTGQAQQRRQVETFTEEDLLFSSVQGASSQAIKF